MDDVAVVTRLFLREIAELRAENEQLKLAYERLYYENQNLVRSREHRRHDASDASDPWPNKRPRHLQGVCVVGFPYLGHAHTSARAHTHTHKHVCT